MNLNHKTVAYTVEYIQILQQCNDSLQLFKYILLMHTVNELALLNNACFSLTDVCGGQQSVEIQNGPLYRVKGFPTSIFCNVSGLSHSRKQDFDFLIYKAKNPDNGIQIISTNDPNYAYAVYSTRVHAKSIVIERLSGTSVVLHIKSLVMDDSGTYECHTPNPYTEYFGSYSDTTTLNGNLFYY